MASGPSSTRHGKSSFVHWGTNTRFFERHSHSALAEIAEAFRVLTPEKSFTAKELGALMRAHGMHPTDDEVNEIIRAMDQHGTGVISFDEFAALMGRQVELEEIEQLRTTFGSIDADNTGFISTRDFTQLFAMHGEKSTPEELDEMLQFADPQDTGKVDYNLFLSTLAYRLAT